MIKKIKKIEQQEVCELEYLECDCCRRKFYPGSKDLFEIQEFLRIRETGGYGSIFGDGAEIKGDFCQHCVKKLLGAYLRISPDWLERESVKYLFKCALCDFRSYDPDEYQKHSEILHGEFNYYSEEEVGKECFIKELEAYGKPEEQSFKCKHCGQTEFLRPDHAGQYCDTIDEENRPYMCLHCVANRSI